jgi:hypothetical protein
MHLGEARSESRLEGTPLISRTKIILNTLSKTRSARDQDQESIRMTTQK